MRLKRGRQTTERQLAETYRTRVNFTGRGLGSLAGRIDGVDAEIEALLAGRDRISVLEVGCGIGSALLGLAAKHGERISLVGVNRDASDGGRDLLAYNAKMSGIPAEVSNAISIRFADASERLPFPDASFDLVFSQATWLFIGDKVRALSEVSRMLRPGGVGKIQFISSLKRNDAFKAPLFEVRERGAVVDPIEFFGRSEGVSLRKKGRHHVAEVTAGFKLHAPLRLVEQVRLRDHGASFVGIRSVYESGSEARIPAPPDHGDAGATGL